MAQPNEDTIRQLLLSPPLAPAVSIYMPTHDTHSPPNMYEDEVRFKNLRSQALAIIHADEDTDEKEAQAINAMLLGLEENLEFWETRGPGLAVFVSPRGITTIELPLTCDEYVAVDERFHLSPIIGFLERLPVYYILLVSEKEPLLFHGDMYNVRPAAITLPFSGRSGSEVIKEQKHSTHLPPKRIDARPEYFGDSFPVHNTEERLNFFKTVDRALVEQLDKNQPLILAGTEQDVTDFRGIATYRPILGKRLPYVNTAADIRRLYLDASTLIQEEIIDRQEQAITDRFEQLHAHNRAVAQIAAIEGAANTGRIDTLLLKLVRYTADNMHSSTADSPKLVFLPDKQMATADYLAVQTWRNGGKIILMRDTSQTSPKNAPVGAILRY